MRNVNSFYNDYHVMSYDDNNVVSCYRDTPIEERIIMDAKRDSITSSDFGPQYTVATDVTFDYDLGLEIIECEHELEQSDEGYICVKCKRFYPSMVKTTEVYTYLDTVGFDKDEDKYLPDNNYLDWYTDYKQNPELKSLVSRPMFCDPNNSDSIEFKMKFPRKYVNHDLDFYDTYGGLLPEDIDEEWEENVKCSYIEDSDNEEEEEKKDSTVEAKVPIEFSKDLTELPSNMLNFWGYPRLGKNDAGGKSVVWTAVRYSRDKAIVRMVESMEFLTEDELEWLTEILLDEGITLSKNVTNTLCVTNVRVKLNKERNVFEYCNEWQRIRNEEITSGLKELVSDYVININLKPSTKYTNQYFIEAKVNIDGKTFVICRTNKSTNWFANGATNEQLTRIIPALRTYWIKHNLKAVANILIKPERKIEPKSNKSELDNLLSNYLV